MRRLMMSVGLFVSVIATIAAIATGEWAWMMGGGAVGLAIWQFRRCHHPGPLGLLPPSKDDSGSAIPARWFCDACGRSWPAKIEHGHPPVQRFEGYDPSKAVNAAKRADDHARRQRALAVRRAGLVTPRQPRPRHDSAPIVAIRRFAK